MPSTFPTSTQDDQPATGGGDPLSYDVKTDGGNWLSDSLMQDLSLPPIDETSTEKVEQPTFGELMAGADQQGAALATLATTLAEATFTSGHEYLLEPKTLDAIVEARANMRGVRRSREMIEIADMGLWDSLKHGVSHPMSVMLPSAWQSLRSQAGMIPAIGGAAAAGGPAGLGIATGGASAWIEGTATFFDSIEQTMAERGLQVNSAADWRKALSDPAVYSAARNKAVKSGIAVGVFDGLSAGILGKATSEAGGGLARKLATGATEAVAIDAPVGAMGEATKQMATEGRITSPSDIAAEMFAGLPMGGFQVAAGVLARHGNVRMNESEQAAARMVSEWVALRHAEDMATPPTPDEAKAQIDPTTEATIDTLSGMKIDDLAAAAISEGIDVPGDVTEADKPALIAKIMDEADKKLELESDDIEEAGTVTPEEQAAAEVPVIEEAATPQPSPSISAPSEQTVPTEPVAAAPASDRSPPIEIEFPKKKLADMIEEKWPGITGRIGQVDREGMGDAAQRAVDTAEHQGDDTDRFIARVFQMDKEGHLSREEIGSLVGINTDDIEAGDSFGIDGETVNVVAADGATVTFETKEPDTSLPIGDGEDVIEPGKVTTYTIPRGQTIPMNQGSHTLSAETNAPQPVSQAKPKEAKPATGPDVANMPSKQLHALARKAGLSESEIRKRGDEWLRENLAKFVESELSTTVDSVESAGSPVPRGKRSGDSGGTVVYHHSDKTIESFGAGGAYFTSSEHGYARRTGSQHNNPRRLDLQSLKLANKKQATAAGLFRGDKEAYINSLKAAGFDGAKYDENGDTTYFIIDEKNILPLEQPTPSKLESFGKSIEDRGRQLMAGSPSVLTRGVRGSRSGSTTLHTQIAGAALMAFGRSIRYGATSYKAVKQVVERVVNEMGKTNRNLKNQTERITRDVMKLLRQTKGDQGKIDSVIAAYSAKAQAKDVKRTGVGVKEQIRETTGAGMRGREEKTVTEPEALKARMKGQVLAGRVAFVAGKIGEKMDAEVKKLDPKKVKVGFLKTFGAAWNTLFKSTKPHEIVQDVARFIKETHKANDGTFVGAGPVSAETIELALRLDAKKYNALTEDEATAIREMVRLFKAEHNVWNKALGDAQAKSMAQASMALAADVNRRPELDASLGTAKSRKGVRMFLDYRATARTLASALGQVARRFFHDNFVKPQEKMFQRIMRVHDDMHATFAEHGITTKGERDKWIDDRRLRIESFPLPDGRTISLTRSEVMSLYALSQRSNAEDVMTRNGVKSKRHKGLADARYVIAAPETQTKQFQDAVAKADERVQQAMKSADPDALKIAQAVRSAAEDRLNGAIERYVTDAIRMITGELTQTEKDVVDAAIESIQTNITPDANAVSELLFGSPIFTESDYTMRMLIDRAGTWDNTDVRQILDLQTFFTAWIENAGFTKELQKHKNPVMLGDFFSEIDAQARDMSVYADLLIPIRDARMLLTAKPVQQALRTRFGTNTEQRIVRTLAKLTGMQRDPKTTAEKATAWLVRNIASSLLGLKASVFLANRVGGSITLQAHLSPKEMALFGKRTASGKPGGFTKEEKSALAELETNGYMGHRWKELDSYRLAIPGLEDRDVSLSKRRELTRFWRRVRRVADYATRHMRYAERKNAVSAYLAMQDAGVPKAEAISRVANITRQTQNPVTALEESELIDDVKTNPAVAAAWLFAGQGEILANMIIEPLVRGDKKQAAKATAFVLASSVALIAARELLRFASKGFKEEEDKRKQRDAGDLATSLLSETANIVAPGFGDLLNEGVRRLRHKPTSQGSLWDDSLTSPLSSIMPDVIDSIRDGKNPKWDRVIRNTLKLIDTLTGLPASNAADYAKPLLGQ